MEVWLSRAAADDDERQRQRDDLWRPPPGHHTPGAPPAGYRTVAELMALQASLAADDT